MKTPKDRPIPPDVVKEVVALLTDLELLMRVNAPLGDGSACHVATLKLLKKMGVTP
jgi:hypothetical protein